jgi:hypothetical protein
VQDFDVCLRTPECYTPLISHCQLAVVADEDEAVQRALQRPEAVDMVVAFQGPGLQSYHLRTNHTDVPTTRELFERFDLTPPRRAQSKEWRC